MTPSPEEDAVTRFLGRLMELVPPVSTQVRIGKDGAASPFVRSLVEEILRGALVDGHTIDRSNEDEPLSQWDGWIVIYSPVPVFIQTNHKVGHG